MARDKDDDLFVDDELTAAFLDDEALQLGESDDADDDNDDRDRDWIETGEAEIDGQLPVDIYETKQHLVVKCRMPGVDRDKLEVGLFDNTLRIRGTSSAKIEHEVENHLVSECYWGEFTRSVGLPLPVKEEGVEAVLAEGILTITFVKIKQDDAVKKIDIK